jgi:hypothetical protein
LIGVFESAFTPIVQSALHHKLLTSTVVAGDLAYTWPSPKDEYDLDKMKPYRQAEGWRREPIVSFAVFPGLKLTLNNGWVSKDYDAVGALVRLWVRPHISDFEPRAPIP